MGMFDTIYLEKPISCKTCGADILDFQTKEFACLMANYHVGSILLGIRFCAESSRTRSARRPVNRCGPMCIWSSVTRFLPGWSQTKTRRWRAWSPWTDWTLCGGFMRRGKKTRQWQRRFFLLYHELGKWQSHMEEQKKPTEPESESTERRRRLSSIWRASDEILEAPDPIAKTLEIHDPKNEERASGYF